MNYKEYQKSRNLAWEILIHEKVTELPVKVRMICRGMGVEVKMYSGQADNSGFSTMVDGVPHIFVRNDEPIERQRFTIAHELGHIMLGHVGKYKLVNREPSPDDNPIEQAANVFASRLLAPACVLWGCGAETAEQIAGLCNISKTAAQLRAERMKVLYVRNSFLTSPLEREVYRNFLEYIEKHRL